MKNKKADLEKIYISLFSLKGSDFLNEAEHTKRDI